MIEKKLPIIGLFKNPVSVGIFTAVGSTFFAINYYAMAHLPGSRDFMCVMGGNLTVIGIIFSVLLSIAAGLLAGGMWEKMTLNATAKNWKMGSASGIGLLLGTLTSFCTVCTFPLIGLFGVSSLMSFMSEHQLIFKAASLALMGLGLYLLNQQLKNECGFLCKITQ
ncbi:hypothetical protein IPJ72_00660 [Candidatus Peregrinibacteria bacterium]|nr:MAG: hypothetical protein IPJ72_00660 [Candidatus Peregrinibacteria bacterium]